MGQAGYFKCNNCRNRFKSRMGGSTICIEYRCVACDHIKEITTSQRGTPDFREPTKEEIGTCSRCGGEMRDDLGPMCRKCGSRDVEIDEITMFYD